MNNTMKKGTLVLSLDFELIWGVFDHIDPKVKISYFENTRKIIPQLCELFASNSIAVTWATVGMLMHDNWDDWMDHRPQIKPDYINPLLNPYSFAQKNKDSIPQTLFFAPGLVRLIQQTPYQELATHTYSHYYCLEKGESTVAFRADLETALVLAERFDSPIKSLVFPRNQYSTAHIKVCADLGINSVRINPDIWFWDNESQNAKIFKKIFRTADAYLPIKKMVYNSDNIKQMDNVVLQPASRFYRPFGNSNIKRLLHRNRVFKEMEAAARAGEFYHLWWHPHNFGSEPEICMHELKLLVAYFKKLQDEYGMQSLTMTEVSTNHVNLQL